MKNVLIDMQKATPSINGVWPLASLITLGCRHNSVNYSFSPQNVDSAHCSRPAERFPADLRWACGNPTWSLWFVCFEGATNSNFGARKQQPESFDANLIKKIFGAGHTTHNKVNILTNVRGQSKGILTLAL